MPAQVIPATMSSTEDKSLLATTAPPPRRLKSIAAAAALLGLSFGLGAVVASSVNGNQPIVDNPRLDNPSMYHSTRARASTT